MHLKKTALIFTATILLFSLLLMIKYRATVLPLLQKKCPLFALHENSSPKSSPVYKSTAIEKILIDALTELETNRNEISVIHLLEDSTININAAVPRGRPIEWIIWYLTSTASKAGYPTKDCFCEENPVQCTITLTSTRKAQPTVKIILTQSRRFYSSAAKLAIVITDFIYHTDATANGFFSFPEPLTLSMIGSRKMAVSSAEIAHENHKEIVLMLPMEPLSRPYMQLRDETIMLHYPHDKIKELINHSAERIPFYTGFSNLCGTRILDDSQIMKVIFSEIADKKGYFLIDQPQRRSMITAIARESGVPFRFVDITLDSTGSADASVADSLKHAALIAQKKGSAVFCGRPTSQLLEAATKLLPYFQHNGIELVPASELVGQARP